MAASGAREWPEVRQTDVCIISKDMVMPAKPTPRHSCFLSCLDILWKHMHYNQRVIFYEGALPASGDGGIRRVEALKSSLALCLVHYYPWCGRLSERDSAASTGNRLFIDCNTEGGVEFVEAMVDLPISRLSLQGFQTKPFFEELCPKIDHTGDRLYSSPLLSVQATFFSDGGLSLGVSQSHVVADGKALWDFMVSWGECARGLPISRHPLLDREVLAAQNLPLEEEAEWDPVVRSTRDDEAAEEEEDQSKAASSGLGVGTEPSAEDTATTPVTAQEPVSANGRRVGTPDKSSAAENPSTVLQARTQCIFILPSSAISQLKVEDGEVHTTYEVICAHFWQRLTLARRSPPHEPTMFSVLTNYRGRMNPPLSPSYFGNGVGIGVSLTTTKKICSESLHAIASRIHATVVYTVQESTITSFMHFVEAHLHDLVGTTFKKFPQGQSLMVASSTRFPAYQVDFGWGKPAAVRSPKVPGEGELVFFGGNPRLHRGDVEICLCLSSDVLRRLLKDPLFLGVPPSHPFEDQEAQI